MEMIQNFLEPEFYYQFVDVLGPFRFLVGILLAMIEAFFPPLPLAAFVTINVIIFGFWQGYALSYIGNVSGSYFVFLIISRFGREHIHNYAKKHERARSLLHWIHDKGIFPIIVLLTFPFTPSVIIGGLAAFAEVKKLEYLYALIIGKLFMIFSLSFIGVNIKAFYENPLRSIGFILLTIIFSFVANKIMEKYEKRVLRHKVNHDHVHHLLKKNKR